MTELASTPAVAALNRTAELAADNVNAVRAAAEQFRSAQLNYALILERAAAGCEITDSEFEAAEQAMAAAGQRVRRLAAVAKIHAGALTALLPAARAEVEGQTLGGQSSPDAGGGGHN